MIIIILNTPVTHRLDYIYRYIPAHDGRQRVSEDYTCGVPVEVQQIHIRKSLHLYARGSCFTSIRLEGTKDKPLYVQILNQQNLLYPEPGPGPRILLYESHPSYETAIQFWKSATPFKNE